MSIQRVVALAGQAHGAANVEVSGAFGHGIAAHGKVHQAILVDIAEQDLQHSAVPVQPQVAAAHGAHPWQRSRVLDGDIQGFGVASSLFRMPGVESKRLKDMVQIFRIHVAG